MTNVCRLSYAWVAWSLSLFLPSAPHGHATVGFRGQTVVQVQLSLRPLMMGNGDKRTPLLQEGWEHTQPPNRM